MTRSLVLLSVAVCSLTAPALAADGFEPENTLPWPLYQQDGTTPREALGNAFGEYQEYSGWPDYVHTGIDIRGNEGDVVKVVASGNIWVTVNYDDDSCEELSSCRMYLKDSAERYIYYYAHLALHDEDQHGDVTAATREKIINASVWVEGDGTYPIQPGTSITAGTVLSRIGPFNELGDFPHLHFAIVDSEENYDAINPLTALQRTATSIDLIDDEPPEIDEIRLLDDDSGADVTPADACTPVSGPLDIAASMFDSFYTDPPPQLLDSSHLSRFGVYEASYDVRNVQTGAGPGGTWYRFDRAPLRCAGSLRGNACPVALDEGDFAEHSFLVSTGMFIVAQDYTPELWVDSWSTSGYSPGDLEIYWHLLTNEWGVDGSWDTDAGADGWYQITALAKDADGNQTPSTRFVAIDNDGNYEDVADAFVRDNSDDFGNIPSNVGDRPFWASPDIFVMQKGEVPGQYDSPPSLLLAPDVEYDVYVRVLNRSCATVSNIGAQIWSANPAMFQEEDEWVFITEEGEFEGDLTLSQDQTGFLGPFPWTPTEAEAQSNAGHRCLRVKIDAEDDPVGTEWIPDNNNYSQRNIQFGVSSFDVNNPGIATASIGTELRCNGFPFKKKGAVMELSVAYNTAVYAAWLGTPGTTVTLSGGKIVVRFLRCNVKLPNVQLPAGTKLPASFKTVVPPKTPGSWVLDLHGYYNGQVRGGMSFFAKAP